MQTDHFQPPHPRHNYGHGQPRPLQGAGSDKEALLKNIAPLELKQLEKLVEHIEQQIELNGIYAHETKLNPYDFEYICHHLGRVVGEDQIRLNITERNLHSPGAIDFHTDSPLADIISWYCWKNDPAGAPTWLINMDPVAQDFTKEEIELLKKIMQSCPNRTRQKNVPVPLVLSEDNNKRLKFFFTPWLLMPIEDSKVKKTYEKFLQYIQKRKQNALVKIDLTPGQCFFINNRRVFHGRGSIDSNSPRYLQRIWISRDEGIQQLMF